MLPYLVRDAALTADGGPDMASEDPESTMLQIPCSMRVDWKHSRNVLVKHLLNTLHLDKDHHVLFRAGETQS